MIQISGTTFQFKENWPLDHIEKSILQHMQDAHNIYSYPSLEELQFEIKMRKNIINSATEMNETKAQFTIFEQSRCNPAYWQLTAAGGFLQRLDVKPSDAIMDIYQNSSLYAFECATASVIIYYYAMLQTIGKHLFDAYFQNLYLYSWHADTDLGLVTFYTSSFLPGDIVYFENPDFDLKTPWFRGLNAIILDDGRFFGHGFSIKTNHEIIQVLNERRIAGSNRSAELTSLVTRPSFIHISGLAKGQTRNIAYKLRLPVVHHNHSSISTLRYQKYLIQLGYLFKG
ncbi:protein-glutamine gamma-glutamyltransferase [Niallia sp.]|uniref:protein-glutamine gamma-glutamyltransferase n=1 Tax=Niallia sp. TaxID=2837523 RepID=UPI0028992787|nr:protein-glutamine gamma-glutamyltransferase [Niallia sp.]